ncbi:MAG: hypothetical protein KJ042_01025 [Deltaproteobacteria bacterium]|nr:hypothetical protein [Deltaproteobacteria bacterium]
MRIRKRPRRSRAGVAEVGVAAITFLGLTGVVAIVAIVAMSLLVVSLVVVVVSVSCSGDDENDDEGGCGSVEETTDDDTADDDTGDDDIEPPPGGDLDHLGHVTWQGIQLAIEGGNYMNVRWSEADADSPHRAWLVIGDAAGADVLRPFATIEPYVEVEAPEGNPYAVIRHVIVSPPRNDAAGACGAANTLGQMNWYIDRVTGVLTGALLARCENSADTNPVRVYRISGQWPVEAIPDPQTPDDDTGNDDIDDDTVDDDTTDDDTADDDTVDDETSDDDTSDDDTVAGNDDAFARRAA